MIFLQNWYPRETSLLFTGRQMLCSMSVRKCIRFCIPELQSWSEVKNTIWSLWKHKIINSCAKSAWYARRQHSYNICKDFLTHNSGMKNWNFTKKYTVHNTINSNNYAKFEVNWPRGSQFTAQHRKNRLQFDE
jgi:hypothetical protein